MKLILTASSCHHLLSRLLIHSVIPITSRLTQWWFIADEVQNKAHLSGVSVSLYCSLLLYILKHSTEKKTRVDKLVYYRQLWQISSSTANPLITFASLGVGSGHWSNSSHLLLHLHPGEKLVNCACRLTLHSRLLRQNFPLELLQESERENWNNTHPPKSVSLYSVDRSSLGDKCLTKHKAIIARHQLSDESL